MLQLIIAHLTSAASAGRFASEVFDRNEIASAVFAAMTIALKVFASKVFASTAFNQKNDLSQSVGFSVTVTQRNKSVTFK